MQRAIAMRRLGLGLLCCLLATPLAAQTVRGRVVDAAGTPIGGALVEWSDSVGHPMMRMLATSRGTFAFLVNRAGHYSLRVAAIGYLPVVGRPVAVVATDITLPDIALDRVVFRLPDLVAAGKSKACGLDELRSGTFADVLESAHTALQVADAAFDAQTIGFRVQLVRTTSFIGNPNGSSVDTSIAVLSSWPLRSTDLDSLEQVGFAREPTASEPPGEIYYGPDARVLFSDWFLDSHCFALVVDKRGRSADSVRMRFTPRQKPKRVDLDGEMVFDRATMSLRRLEFRHVHLPDWVPAGSAGGSITFDRWPSGLWLSVAWSIRGPIEAMVNVSQPARERAPRPVLKISRRAAGLATLSGRVLEVIGN